MEHRRLPPIFALSLAALAFAVWAVGATLVIVFTDPK